MNTPVDDLYPLSPLQQGMLFHAQLEPESGLYIERLRYSLHGDLIMPAFEKAWEQVIARHPVLRTAFISEGLAEPHQIVMREIQLPLEKLDWRHLPPNEQTKQIAERFSQHQFLNYDLSKAPLMALTLIQIENERHEFIWSYHHLLLDGWSVPLLLGELMMLYEANCQNVDLPLEPARPFRDYIEWLQQQDPQQAEAFWQQALADVVEPTTIDLIGSHSEDSNSHAPEMVDSAGPATSRFGSVKLRLTAETTKQLQTLAQNHRLTLNTVIQGAWALLLSRYSDKQDVIFGTVVSGRPAALTGVETMVGMLMNTLPVCIRISPQEQLIPWLQNIQERQFAARQYEYSPLVQIQQWSQIPSEQPLFESLVVFENRTMGASSAHSDDTPPQQPQTRLEIRDATHIGSTTGYPLTIVVHPDDELSMVIDFDLEHFSESQMLQIQNHLQIMLEGIANNPDDLPTELPMLSEAERNKVLYAWNETATDYPKESTIQRLFAEQVEATPDAIALTFGDQALTYRDLNERANQLAHWLKSHGVGPEQTVGICVERSIEMVIGILGILKADGVYLPLDPAYPDERIAFMLEDSEASIILTLAHLKEQLPSHTARVLSLDSDWAIVAQSDTAEPPSQSRSSNLAYIMYTSGSTGIPKGTSITHQSVIRLVKETNYAKFDAQQVFLQYSPISFDAATLELWGSLLNGARLAICPPHKLSMEELGGVIQKHQVTTLWLTSGLFNLLVDERLDDLSTVRQLLAGGDVLSVPHVKKVLSDLKECQLINGYGPTENTTFATCFPIASEADIVTSVPVGKPIANTQVYLLDSHLNPVPIGVPGELYIGGDGLARDYHRRPALTAEKFIPNPFGSQDGSRLYRTGDIARYRRDGVIEFMGRRDHQVKLRGFRIEMGDIEAALLAHSAIQSAAVLALPDSTGDKRLIAYVVPEGAPVDTDELRGFLKARLPEYMVPTAFVVLDALPLDPNGKIDRRTLASASEAAKPESTSAVVLPRTPVEELIAPIWQAILGLEQISIHDDFFELGGHSLRATQVISRLREAFQIELPLHHVFESSTIAKLAVQVELAMATTDGVKAPPITAVAQEESLPLSYAQQRLWFIDQIEPGNPAYNIPTAVRLKGKLDVEVLQACFNEIVSRHEVLRTTFSTNASGEPELQIVSELLVNLPLEDLSNIELGEQEALIQKIGAEEASHSFDLAMGPLFRVRMVRLAEAEHVLFLTMHHVVSDEWSFGILTRELTALYTAFINGEASPLPDLPVQYADFAHWQRSWLQGDVLEAQLSYWRQHLGTSVPQLNLPYDAPKPAVQTFAGALHSEMLDAKVASGLRELSKQEGVTLFMLMLTALQALLHRYADGDDVVVGTDIANRNRLETEGLIGFFVNHLLLHGNLSGSPTFKSLLSQAREKTLGAYAHQDLPFDQLVAALQPERTQSHTPLFQVLFVFGNPSMPTVEAPGLTLEGVASDLVLSKYDLTLFVVESAEQLNITWRYSTERFQQATIQKLTERLIRVLKAVVDNPNIRLHRLERLSDTAEESIGDSKQQRARTRERRRTKRRGVSLVPEKEPA